MRIFFQSVLYLNVGIGSLFFVIWLLTSFPFFGSSVLAEEVVKKAPTPSSAIQGEPSSGENGKISSSGGSGVKTSKKSLSVEQKKEAKVESSSVSTNKKNPSAQSAGAQALPAPVPKKEDPSVQSAEASAPSTQSGEIPVPSVSVPNKQAPSVQSGGDAPTPSVLPNTNTIGPAVNDEKGKAVQRKGASVVDSSPVPPPPGFSESVVPSAQEKIPPPPSVNNVEGKMQPQMGKEENNIDENVSAPAISSSSLNNLLESAKNFQKEKGASAEAAHDLMNINQKVVEIYNMLSNYQYDSSDRRDPFTSFKEEMMEESKDSKKVIRPIHATSQFNLEEIKLKGIKWNSGLGPSTALFQTPDNATHHLRKNDWIGNNGGVVYQLKEDEVVVLEPRLTGTGNKEENSYVPIIVRLERWTDEKKSEQLNKSVGTTKGI